MNKDRRNRIEEVKDQIEEVKILIEEISDEEQDCLDNLPESLQYGKNGDKMTSAINALGNSISSLDNALKFLKEATT